VAAPVATPAAASSALAGWLPWLAGVTAGGLAGLAMWLLHRSRLAG
jgi:hypothetical protein